MTFAPVLRSRHFRSGTIERTSAPLSVLRRVIATARDSFRLGRRSSKFDIHDRFMKARASQDSAPKCPFSMQFLHGYVQFLRCLAEH